MGGRLQEVLSPHPFNVLLVLSPRPNSNHQIDAKDAENGGKRNGILSKVHVEYFVEVDWIWSHQHAACYKK